MIKNIIFFIDITPCQMTIINEDENIINLSPLLSDYFSVSQRTNKEEIFSYFFNETKYALITFNLKSKIKIIENDTIIYDNEISNFLKIYEFKENTNYTIIYYFLNFNIYSNPIDFQFYSHPKFFKHDFKKNPLIIYGNQDNDYYFDIDISDYKLGENIEFYATGYVHSIGYQFKNDFKEKNFIKFESYYNNIAIKKSKNDSSLIIFFKSNSIIGDYSMISLFKPEEINSDYNSVIKGPKLFLIEYNLLNGINSIGIESNESFFIYEQDVQNLKYSSYKESYIRYLNLFITKQNNLESDIYQKIFIYFNSSNNAIFTVKKLNYSIFSGYNRYQLYNKPTVEYFQLCQRDNTPKELYFYTSENNIYKIKEVYDIFSSIFGKFNTYFINENRIQNISDLNFDKNRRK